MTPHHGSGQDDDPNRRPGTGAGGPRHGYRPPDPPQQPPQPSYGEPPYGQDPYATGSRGQDPYGQDPYGAGPRGQNPYARDSQAQAPYGTGPYGQAQAPSTPPPAGPNPYPPGPPPQPYGPPQPQSPTGGHPYGAPPQQPPPYTNPQAYRPGPHDRPAYLPPLYRPEEGTGGAGFALPDEYKAPPHQHPAALPKRLFRLPKTVRIIATALTLVIGTGVAVGMPYRDAQHDYQAQKRTALSYTQVPKNGHGTIAGIKFAAGPVTKGDAAMQYSAPAGTTAVKALIGHRAPDTRTEAKTTYLEYVFRDNRGRTWQADDLPEFKLSKGKDKFDTISALVPTAVAGQVRAVVRPIQVLDPDEDPTRVPKDPALEFQR